jgi:hypothetical protein
MTCTATDVAADDPRDGHSTDWRPIPDPTTLTTEQLRRELSALREILTARLDAMDRATALLSETVNRTPTVIQTEISHVRELTEEKFSDVARISEERLNGIALQFAERDVRTDQAAKSSKDALDAALQAAKELVAANNDSASAAAVKTETSFTKQIDQIGTIISTLEKALDARITELKERIDRGEGSTAGSAGTRTEQRLNMNTVVAVLALLLSAVIVFAAIHK